MQELERAKNILEENHFLFDVPADMREDLEEAGFHVHKQMKTPVVNMRQFVKVSDLPEKWQSLIARGVQENLIKTYV